MQLAQVTLPEIVVTGERVATGAASIEMTDLPEVVVYGSRSTLLADAAAETPAQG